MKFDEIDAKLRVFETSHDHCVLPGVFMVARLDGRAIGHRLKARVYLLEGGAPVDLRLARAE